MKREQGFTLIELLTALSLFMVVMTIAMGSVVSIFDANRKTQSESAVMNNLNLAVESLSREMRFGKNYHCGSGDYTAPQNCPSGDTSVSFLSSNGVQMVYRLNGTALERSVDGGSTFAAVTAPEIVLENVKFYVLGAGAPPSNTLQPKVVMTIKGYSGTKQNTKTDFSLETLVSQRRLDNGQ